jgi:hypothetical protein
MFKRTAGVSCSLKESIDGLELKSTCDVNLLSKLSIIFKEWRVVNNMYRDGARV